MTERLRLSRQQLASFLGDQRQIRQFEELLARVTNIPPSSVDDASAAIATLEARSAQAAGEIEAVGGDAMAGLSALEARIAEDAESDQVGIAPPQQPLRVDELEDVSAASPTDYNALQFDATAAQWIARAFLAGLKFGGGGADYSFFEADGTLRFDGAASVWVDIDFPIIVRTTEPGIPTLTTIQGNITAPQWAVNDANQCEAQEMVHSWKQGSESQWHVHMLTNGTDATDRWVNWEIEWFWVNPNGSASATTTTAVECLIPAGTAPKTMFIYELSRPTLTGGLIGAHVYARLRRIANTTPGRAAPTSNPWCSMLQMHVENDTVGSRQIFTK